MNPPDDNREITIIQSRGLLIKDQIYDAVLTNRRIILTGYKDQKPRSLILRDLQNIELDTGAFGEPEIILFFPSAMGETKKVILHFSSKNIPDPHQVRLLWYSEINKNLQPTAPAFSPAPLLKKPAVAQVFCVRCGTKFTDGSAFCNKCGTKILYPAQPLPMELSDNSVQEKVVTPEISTGKIALPHKKSPIPFTNDSYKKEKVPFNTPLHKEHGKKKSFFTGSRTRKPAILVVSALVGVIVLIAVFFVLVPPVSRGSDLTSFGMNSTIPEVTNASSTSDPVVSLTTILKTTRTPATPAQTSTPVQTSIPVQTSTTVQTNTPVQTNIPGVVVVPPSFTTAPGDPYSIFISYSSLFNKGDAAGIFDLLSENMKSRYSVGTLNNELAATRSNGYSIEKIQVNNQIIEEDSAILEMDISWKSAGSPITSTPRLFFLYENNQYKLDSLVLSPYNS